LPHEASTEEEITVGAGTEDEKSTVESGKTILQESQQFVLPGDMIGTSEEFIPGSNTFEHGGNIYSTATGFVNIDQTTHNISVVPKTSTPPEIEKGDVIIGRISDLKSSMALVEIAKIEGKGEREIVNLQQAAIHVSNVKDRYVKNIMYEFSPFDIVKAKVIDLKSMRLTTAGKDLGVIKAYCGRCHVDLIKQSNNGNKDNKLKCPVCGNTESRNLSSQYGVYEEGKR
jgi:exosome complex component CSL4